MRTPDQMRAFAERGPVFPALHALGPIDWTRWSHAADTLTAALPDHPDRDRRIHHLYLPVLFTCLAWLQRAPHRPLLIGIQAPQGGGKTTLVTHLVDLLTEAGVRSTAVSIDDFYMTRAGQLAVAAANPGNPYLEHRGYPGTHDVVLGRATIAALRNIGGGRIRMPVYDKSRHGGRGDRIPETDWRTVTGPLDLAFVEGWMLGYTPVAESTLSDPDLVAPNRALAAYHAWHDDLDAFIAIRAVNPRAVLRWRVEAEEAMRARGLPALDRAAIDDYIRRFLPAYATWGGVPPNIPADRQLTIWIDDERRATHNKSTP
jgi:D-glycerate 3-kinase